MIRFARAEGLGNDYIVLVSDFAPGFRLEPAVVARLCDRHRGLGGDGVLVPTPSSCADFGVRIFNPDGTEAEKSGNGLRIFARYLLTHHRELRACTIETRGGVVRAELEQESNSGVRVAVDMGEAWFDTSRIPVKVPWGEAIEVPLDLDSGDLVGTAVSVGNPHWVVFCPDADAVPLEEMGPRIERHPWFPNRTNVQFAQVLGPNRVRVRIWERGAGETLASGSSACAVVAAGVRTGRLQRAVEVVMDGGTLEVQIDKDGHVHQRGPVNLLATGTIGEDLERELLALCSG